MREGPRERRRGAMNNSLTGWNETAAEGVWSSVVVRECGVWCGAAQRLGHTSR